MDEIRKIDQNSYRIANLFPSTDNFIIAEFARTCQDDSLIITSKSLETISHNTHSM